MVEEDDWEDSAVDLDSVEVPEQDGFDWDSETVDIDWFPRLNKLRNWENPHGKKRLPTFLFNLD